MADVLQPAKSGRASCRGCGRKIPKGELRFGEHLPNPYTEGETLHWFHLVCAACRIPDKLGPVLQEHGDAVEEAGCLRHLIDQTLAHPRLTRLVRAERASSGRARCRSCKQPIAHGDWRLVLQLIEEGVTSPLGFIHARCAEPYFGTPCLRPRLERLAPDLRAEDLDAIESLSATPPPAAANASEEAAEMAMADASSGSANLEP